MFTVVGTENRRRIRRKAPTLGRVAVPHGVPFYVLRADRRFPTQALFSMAARCARDVLTSLPVPPGAPVRVFEPRLFPMRRAADVFVRLLREAALPPQTLSIGVYDPVAALCGRVSPLLPYAADVRIVTRRPVDFDADVLYAAKRFGAGLTVGESAALLTGCGAVVCAVPDEAFADAPAVLSCVRAAGVFSPVGAALPPAYARLCPPDVPPDLFAAALAELCGVCDAALYACSGVVFDGQNMRTEQAGALWRARFLGRKN
ncbi:MAG: hypothetical protein IJT44_05440 [Clostridia bacterium]|nr:hypothetical protein [Clostridia bacterium]